MSGITGVFYCDARPVERLDLQRMVDTLAHRGPDGAALWNEGPVGLGHRMLWTTPESLREELPFVSESGDLVITADARIDNRAELISALELGDRPPEEIADSQLILGAYDKWGERCPAKLIGDFAFAIWDIRKRHLFCARDHFGIRPFHFFQSERVFVFGSEVKALLCLPEVPRRLNELRIGYHLAGIIPDNSITFYQGIYRLLPAHSVTVNQHGAHLQAYWSLDPSRELQLESDHAYADRFRELFTEAVRCRLRSAFPVGCSLSGGLDSSAVTCVARDLLSLNGGDERLHTISAIYDKTPECDERPFIAAVLDSGDLKPSFVQMDQISPLTNYERVFRHGDEPFTSPTFYIAWGLSLAAQQHGVRVLLDGIDGDTALSHGEGYLAELAWTGQWSVFAHEAKALSQHENFPSVPLLLGYYATPHLVELAQGLRWASFLGEVNGLATNFNVSRRALVWSLGVKSITPESIKRVWRTINGREKSIDSSDSIMRKEFSKRLSLDDQIENIAESHSVPARTAGEEHAKALTSDLIPYVFELANRASVACSTESRHPFSDRRLIEFCLALPPQQKLNGGWTRVVMRRALAGILPEQIQWRGGKTLNSAAFTYGLIGHEKALLDEVILGNQGDIETYVDIDLLRSTYRRYLSEKRTSDEMTIWNAVTLALWLRYTGMRA